jgi:hypothetical protein
MKGLLSLGTCKNFPERLAVILEEGPVPALSEGWMKGPVPASVEGLVAALLEG